MPINLLAIDFETQSDDAKTTRITEVGAAWTTVGALPENESSLNWPPGKISFFCHELDYPPQTEFIVELTGITDDMLRRDGISRADAMVRLMTLIQRADVVFAHKKIFDQTVFESTCKLLGISYPQKEWICTLAEFEWPRKFTCLKLGHLAFEHGMFDGGHFERANLHRAGDDAELLLHLITNYYNLQDILAYARSPWLYFKADPIAPWKDGGEHTGIAKKMGFSWEQVRHDDRRFPKTWVARVKDKNLKKFTETIAGAPFRISPIEGIGGHNG